MGIGIALGGATKGLESAERAARDRQELAIRQGQVDAQNRGLQRLEQNDLRDQADTFIAQGLETAVKTVQAGKDAGDSPEKIAASIEDIMAYVDRISIGVGRDPAFHRTRMDALITGTPTAAETAAAAGTNKAAAQLSQAEALEAGGVDRATALGAAGVIDADDLLARSFVTGAGAQFPTQTPTDIPALPQSLTGKGAKWSPSRQRFFTPDGASFNRQGVPQG